MPRHRANPARPILPGAVIGGVCAAGAAAVLLLALLAARGAGCSGGAEPGLVPAGSGPLVGASEYGGPGDPTSGVIGSSGVDLLREPDSYAELGGTSFATADALGGLPYETPLRITWGSRSAIAYKRDIGLGGGPVDGHPRAIDLWWRLAGSLGIPYENGEWSGAVSIERTPATGAASQLGALPSAAPAAGASSACPSPLGAGVPVIAGDRAVLMPDGLAAAPASAPAAVRAMIASGNAIAGRPYVYGGGHGLPLSVLSPAYDCSSSVEHILYGGGLLAAGDTAASGALESFGLPGPGRWVTIYANPDHVFMYVAGLRWDTWNAAGAGDGSSGIGWHPLVRDANGFVARHPVGL